MRPDAPPQGSTRILLVHNRYRERGGEDAAVERDLVALRRAGHVVETVFFNNEIIASGADRLRAAVEVAHAPRAIAQVEAVAKRFRPDVVHVHNSFPLISPGVHAAMRRLGSATVQTLHNFRLICANGMLTRDGRPCESCLGRSPYQAVLHRCYRGSRLGSLAVARMIDVHRRAGTWTRHVDRLIVLTAFARQTFERAGLPAERIRVRPNGLPDPGAPDGRPRAGILFVGRLTAEKGVAVLADASRLSAAPLTVIGDGPLLGPLTGAGVTALGFRGREEVQAAMASAAAVVVPSLWYEGLPMVVAEAFAAGTPVIASRIGALADLVEDGVTGLHVRPGDAPDLAGAMDRIAGEPDRALAMGQAARRVYERDWTEDVTTRSLLAIYAEAIASRAAEGRASLRGHEMDDRPVEPTLRWGK